MGRRQDLPPEFSATFDVRIARLHGITRSRLRGSDLEAPFHGIRVRTGSATDTEVSDPYERQRRFRVAAARTYSVRQHTGHVFSHQTAASIWGAPLPLAFTDDGTIATEADLELHLCAVGPSPLPRAAGVTGHHSLASMISLREHEGLRVSSPASTWVMLGTLPVDDLIALGDYFCRQWRTGYGRPHAGRPPLATRDELEAALDAGRRRGASRLRRALSSVREDSWSPRETRVRCILVDAGLPEPELNVDVFDESGRFLGCVDMAYPGEKVAVEYLGMLHGERWAQDVERLAALRAAGWIVIEVTAPLLKRPAELARRVAAALGR